MPVFYSVLPKNILTALFPPTPTPGGISQGVYPSFYSISQCGLSYLRFWHSSSCFWYWFWCILGLLVFFFLRSRVPSWIVYLFHEWFFYKVIVPPWFFPSYGFSHKPSIFFLLWLDPLYRMVLPAEGGQLGLKYNRTHDRKARGTSSNRMMHRQGLQCLDLRSLSHSV